MKKPTLIFSALVLVAVLVSCHKSAVNQPAATLVHKWNVLSDTTFYIFGTPMFYVGQSGDYFDFRTDNNLYIKEGTLLDTVQYNIAADGTITIYYKRSLLDYSPPRTTARITANTALLVSSSLVTPAGIFRRTVHLNR